MKPIGWSDVNGWVAEVCFAVCRVRSPNSVDISNIDLIRVELFLGQSGQCQKKTSPRLHRKKDVIVIDCSQVAEQLEAFKIQGLVVIGGFEAFHSVLQLSENR